MSVIARMRLVQAGELKVLAGHAVDADTVLVLRRDNDIEYTLHSVAISEAEQALRSILAASDSERGELVAAVLETCIKPKRKPRRKKQSQT